MKLVLIQYQHQRWHWYYEKENFVHYFCKQFFSFSIHQPLHLTSLKWTLKLSLKEKNCASLVGSHAKSCASGFPPVCAMVCALLWQFPLSPLRPGWWTHPVFCVSPYHCRSILNSAAPPAYPSSPLYLSSQHLPSCLSASLPHYQVSIKTSSSFHLFPSARIFLFFSFLYEFGPSEPGPVRCVCSGLLSLWELPHRIWFAP